MIQTIIMQAILISFAAFLNSLLSYFLQYCFRQGAVFTNWLPFVAKIICYRRNRWAYENIKKMPEKLQRQEAFIMESINHFWYKILGGCYICSNIWQSFFTVFVLLLILDLKEVAIWFIPYSLLSSFFLRKIWNDEKD